MSDNNILENGIICDSMEEFCNACEQYFNADILENETEEEYVERIRANVPENVGVIADWYYEDDASICYVWLVCCKNGLVYSYNVY